MKISYHLAFLIIIFHSFYNLRCMELQPSQQEILSLEYIPFSEEKDSKTTFVPQGFYVTLEGEAESYAFMSPLRPCAGIIIGDQKNTVVIHFHAWNKINCLTNLLKTTLEFDDSDAIKGYVFSHAVHKDTYDQHFKVDTIGETHEEWLDFIRYTLVNGLNLPSSSIKRSLCPNEGEAKKYNYSIACDGLFDENGFPVLYRCKPHKWLNSERAHDYSVIQCKKSKVLSFAEGNEEEHTIPVFPALKHNLSFIKNIPRHLLCPKAATHTA